MYLPHVTFVLTRRCCRTSSCPDVLHVFLSRFFGIWARMFFFFFFFKMVHYHLLVVSVTLTLWCLPENPLPALDELISAMPYSVLMVDTPLDRSPQCESSDASLSATARQMVEQCHLTSKNPTVKVTWSELRTNLYRSWTVEKLRSSFFFERKACHLIVDCSKCDRDRVTMATTASKKVATQVARGRGRRLEIRPKTGELVVFTRLPWSRFFAWSSKTRHLRLEE